MNVLLFILRIKKRLRKTNKNGKMIILSLPVIVNRQWLTVTVYSVINGHWLTVTSHCTSIFTKNDLRQILLKGWSVLLITDDRTTICPRTIRQNWPPMDRLG